MNLILFGFKGCGKTFWGKKLSSSLKREFIDTDDWMIDRFKEKEGRIYPISTIYQLLGEKGFRELEREVVFSLKEGERVISLGGGTLLMKENIEHLKNIGELIYLKCNLEKIQKRIGRKTSFFAIGSLEKVYEERCKIYEKIPGFQIDLDALDEATILEQLKSYGF